MGWGRSSRLQIYSHQYPMKWPEINNRVYTVDVSEWRYRSFILLSGRLWWITWSSRCHDLEEVLDVPYSECSWSGSVRARGSQDAGVRVTEAYLTSAHVFSVTRARRMWRETTVTRNCLEGGFNDSPYVSWQVSSNNVKQGIVFLCLKNQGFVNVKR